MKGVPYSKSSFGDMELNYYGNRDILANFSHLIGQNGRVGQLHAFVQIDPNLKKRFSRSILHDFPEDLCSHEKSRSKGDFF